MQSLNLHSGGELVPYEMLRQLQTPPATATHVPIEHLRLVDLVKSTLGMFGHEVTEEHHAIDHEGQRYFGLLSLKSTHTGYTDTCGLRNSHDKKFPIGISFGAKVFVCSNLSFIGNHVIRRKHTANAKRVLPGLVMEIIEPLAQVREAQAKTVERYKAAMITDRTADHAIMSMFRKGIINVQRIPAVLNEWERPSFEDFQERSAWRLFNAATYALSGKALENAAITPRLHQVIDVVCEEVH
jgi:hypothetical protein